MYKIAYQTLKKNIALFGFYVVFTIVVEQFVEVNSSMSFVLGAMIALFSHRMILLDENYGAGDLFKKQGPSGQKPPMLSFFLVSGIGMVVFLMLLAAFFYLLFVQLSGIDLGDKEQITGALVISTMPAVLAYGILLSLFGTVFPAAAVAGDKSPKAALRRGKASFWKTLGRLAIGPFSVGMVGFAGIVMLSNNLITSGVDINSAMVDVPLSVLAYSLNLGTILLGVTALSMAYQSAENQIERGDTIK